MLYFHAGRKRFLRFCTGAGEIPPIGFETSTIQLVLVRGATGVTSSTCFQVLTLPQVSNYDTLKLALDAVLFG